MNLCQCENKKNSFNIEYLRIWNLGYNSSRNPNGLSLKKKSQKILDTWDNSVGKGTCRQGWKPEPHCWDPRDTKRELTLKSLLLTSTHALWCANTHTYTHTLNGVTIHIELWSVTQRMYNAKSKESLNNRFMNGEKRRKKYLRSKMVECSRLWVLGRPTTVSRSFCPRTTDGTLDTQLETEHNHVWGSLSAPKKGKELVNWEKSTKPQAIPASLNPLQEI